MELTLKIKVESTRTKQDDKTANQVEDVSLTYVIPDDFPKDEDGKRARGEFTSMMCAFLSPDNKFYGEDAEV